LKLFEGERRRSKRLPVTGEPIVDEFMPTMEPVGGITELQPMEAGISPAITALARVLGKSVSWVRANWPKISAGLAGLTGGLAVTDLMSPDDPLPFFPDGDTSMVPYQPGANLPLMFGRGIPREWIAYTWDTGTAIFYRLIDGRIAVQRKNGTWKVYRAKKHIVISSNPRIGTFNKAAKRFDKLEKRLTKKVYVRRK